MDVKEGAYRELESLEECLVRSTCSVYLSPAVRQLSGVQYDDEVAAARQPGGEGPSAWAVSVSMDSFGPVPGGSEKGLAGSRLRSVSLLSDTWSLTNPRQQAIFPAHDLRRRKSHFGRRKHQRQLHL